MTGRRFAHVLTLLATAIGCSSDGGVDAPAVVSPASVIVTPATQSILTGATTVLAAQVIGSNGQPMPNATVTWVSEQPSIVTVNGSGTSATATAVAAGTATIRASSGSVSGTATITVTAPVVPAAIAIAPAGPFVLQSGGTTTVTAAVTGSNQQPMPSATVTWTSADPSVVSVSANGGSATLTGLAAGTTTVRAATGTVTAQVQVQVLIPVTRVTVTLRDTVMLKGDSSVVTATAFSGSGAVLTGRAVAWRSSDTTVATVTPNGIVRSRGRGLVTVVATIDGISGSTQGQVRGVSRVFFSPDTITIRAPETGFVLANITVDPGVSGALVWRSLTPAVVSVVTPGNLKALAPGAGRVEISSVADTTMRDTAFVTVPDPCAVPRALPVGGSVTDRFVAEDCGGNTDVFRFTVNATTVLRFNVSGTDSMRLTPLDDYFGSATTLGAVRREVWAVAAAGTRTTRLVLRNPAQAGNAYSLQLTPFGTLPACTDDATLMRGVSFTATINPTCPTQNFVTRAAAPGISFRLRSTTGLPLVIRATAAGYPVVLELTTAASADPAVVALASGAGQPATLSLPVPALDGLLYIVRVAGIPAGATGPLTITVDP